jgi:hypothetical protein
LANRKFPIVKRLPEKYRSQFTLDRMMGNHHLYAVVDIEVLPANLKAGFKLSAVLPKMRSFRPNLSMQLCAA